jgi:hypothetical protein
MEDMMGSVEMGDMMDFVGMGDIEDFVVTEGSSPD